MSSRRWSPPLTARQTTASRSTPSIASARGVAPGEQERGEIEVEPASTSTDSSWAMT